MANQIIKAIPTELYGVTFRSRLEARWAAYFVNHRFYKYRFEYEPSKEFLSGAMLFDGDFYTPDFCVFLSSPCWSLWEVKPKLPTKSFVEKMEKCALAWSMQGEFFHFYLGVGDFYDDYPDVYSYASDPFGNWYWRLLNKTKWDIKAMDTASETRFDI